MVLWGQAPGQRPDCVAVHDARPCWSGIMLGAGLPQRCCGVELGASLLVVVLQTVINRCVCFIER